MSVCVREGRTCRHLHICFSNSARSLLWCYAYKLDITFIQYIFISRTLISNIYKTHFFIAYIYKHVFGILTAVLCVK